MVAAQLGCEEDVAAIDAAGTQRSSHIGLVFIKLRGVDVAITEAQRSVDCAPPAPPTQRPGAEADRRHSCAFDRQVIHARWRPIRSRRQYVKSRRAIFSIEQLNVIRAAEIAEIAPHIPLRARVLEIGAGTGQQAQELQRRGFDVTAIEVADSAYASARVFPVIDYDGTRIPFPERSFDVVFSSNALEHVRDLVGLHAEIRRVLKPDGVAIHVLPTHTWRFWSILSSFVSAFVYLGAALRRMLPGSHDQRGVGRAWYEAARACGAAVLQPRHGERGFGLAELWLFHPRWWRRNFESNGFASLYDKPMGLFYTGSMVFGARLSLERRARLAQILGSSCRLYVMRPAKA